MVGRYLYIMVSVQGYKQFGFKKSVFEAKLFPNGHTNLVRYFFLISLIFRVFFTKPISLVAKTLMPNFTLSSGLIKTFQN